MGSEAGEDAGQRGSSDRQRELRSEAAAGGDFALSLRATERDLAI
jgi:hypothetical protein